MIGFEKIEQQLLNSFNSSKLHHGIIIAGKKGIGKATFIESFCRNILQESATFRANFCKIEKLPDKKNIGITAGASAPELLVQQLIDHLSSLYQVTIETMQGIEENIKFKIPLMLDRNIKLN